MIKRHSKEKDKVVEFYTKNFKRLKRLRENDQIIRTANELQVVKFDKQELLRLKALINIKTNKDQNFMNTFTWLVGLVIAAFVGFGSGLAAGNKEMINKGFVGAIIVITIYACMFLYLMSRVNALFAFEKGVLYYEGLIGELKTNRKVRRMAP